MFRLILIIYLVKALTDLSIAIKSGDFKKKIKNSFYYNNFIILDIVHSNKVDYKLFEIIIDFILLLRNLFREPIYYLKFFICYVLCFILF